MIFQAPPPASAPSPVATVVAEHAISGRTFQAAAAGGLPPLETLLVGEGGDSAAPQPEQRDVLEDFDWTNEKLQREFIRLEQKTLAKKATPDEQHRYAAMKRDRNSRIFADRYVRDYAEIQRLRKLSEKLAEIQQFLRPVNI
jgi:hypothetical protein